MQLLGRGTLSCSDQMVHCLRKLLLLIQLNCQLIETARQLVGLLAVACGKGHHNGGSLRLMLEQRLVFYVNALLALRTRAKDLSSRGLKNRMRQMSVT